MSRVFAPAGISPAEDFVDPRLHAFAAREEEIGLGELIAVKKIEVRIVEAALRVQHYGERRDLKASATLAQEGTQCSGDDIGATAHGFGEYNAGAKFEQTDGGVHEIGKAAAKTSAGDLIAIDTEGGGVVSIHEVACLVVEDDGGAESALLEKARRGEDEGGFAGAEKSADHGEDGFTIGAQNGVLICQHNDLIVTEDSGRASRTGESASEPFGAPHAREGQKSSLRGAHLIRAREMGARELTET